MHFESEVLMTTVGFRCSNKDYTYALIEGTKEKPSITVCDTIAFPVGYSKPQSLSWFIKEIKDIIENHEINGIAIKADEGMAGRSSAYETRVEHEAMIYLACADSGIKSVLKKRKNTIAKDLGLKGKGKYLNTKLDVSVIPNYADYSDKQKDAILVGWSML
jgi:hypothetical protein